MSNEEYLEEILYEAHQLGLASEIISRIPENINQGERTDVFLKVFLEILKEKNLEKSF